MQNVSVRCIALGRGIFRSLTFAALCAIINIRKGGMRVMKVLSCFDKKSEILNLFLIISFAFTVYFFTPTELFLCNQQDLLSDSVHIILPMLLTASAVAGGIFYLSICFWCCTTKHRISW